MRIMVKPANDNAEPEWLGRHDRLTWRFVQKLGSGTARDGRLGRGDLVALRILADEDERLTAGVDVIVKMIERHGEVIVEDSEIAPKGEPSTTLPK